MIVRNEAAIIERCLDAARPAFDAVSICDTGSSDGTPEIVRGWLASRSVPGEVHRHVFRDFAHNRTLSIEAAQATVTTLGWDRSNTWLLFLDADMVLDVAPDFHRGQLRDDIYRILQRNGSLEYPNVRLARASLDARFVGATHEYFSAPAGTSEVLLETLKIDDRNDGGSRSDKYERDRRLLEGELERDPGNVRAMFYLAQTCRGMGDAPKALFWYRRRIEAGGWLEERWYAQSAIGELLAGAGDTRDAARAFIAAIRLDPERPEAFFHLAYTLRALGRHRFAHRAARAGLALGFPADRLLFVDRDILDWGFLREISINAFYTPWREEGLEANEKLGLGRGAPAAVASLATENAIFYTEALPGTSFVRIAPSLPAAFAPCNPSILRRDDGYLINCRAVSYRMDAYQRYSALEPDGVLRTRNFFVETDRDLEYRDQREIVCDAPPLRETWVRGLEDARLFERDGGVGWVATTTEHHPAGPVRMCVSMIEPSGSDALPVPIQGYGDERTQKNWLPFVDRQTGELRALYGLDPVVVLRIDPESGRAEPVVERSHERDLSRFRGSAGPIELPASAGGGRLVVAHEVAFHGLRYYMNRFLRLDDAWDVVEASRPFFFLHRGIEFACGATLSHREDELLITFGVEDREAWLCRIGLDAVTALLRPLPDWPPRRGSGW
jgi:glycosyltransferase involved in cell wall biosynthesis